MACKWYNVCPLRRFERDGKLGEVWARDYCKSDKNWENCRRYQLEESGQFHPDNMLPDGSIDGKLTEK
jgi:hypothetical protein